MALPDPSQWLEKYGDLLFRMAIVRIRDTAAAEDIVQETLLAALKSHFAYRGDSSEQTWLIGILKHKIIDHVRLQIRNKSDHDIESFAVDDKREFTPSGQWQGHWSREFIPVEWGKDPHELMEEQEFWKVFDHCLSLLPTRMGSLFALHVMDGISSETLCNDFDISPTNLRVLLYRCRKQLRECLELHWIKKRGRR